MKNKNVFLSICFIISILILGFDLFFDNKGEFKLSEVYVSLAAFVMLIGTAILQNIELSMQREDLELTRKEMKEQTKEFEENNKQAKFFELLKIKEDIYMNIDREFLEDFIEKYKEEVYNLWKTYLSQNKKLNIMTLGFDSDFESFGNDLELYRKSISSKYNLNENESRVLNEIFGTTFDKSVEQALKRISIPKEFKKLNQFNYILEEMYVDKLLYETFNSVQLNLFGLTDMNFNEIYNNLKTSEEEVLYKILNKNFRINDL